MSCFSSVRSTLTKDFPHSLTTYEKSIVAKKNVFFADLIPSDVDQLLFSRKKRTIRFSTQESRAKEKQLASTSAAVIQSLIFACMHTYYNLCVRDIPWILGSCCCSVLLRITLSFIAVKMDKMKNVQNFMLNNFYITVFLNELAEKVT